MQETHEHNQQWQNLVDGFRDLGGVCDNVIQKRGSLGLGLFPIDPERPIELRAPAELLVPIDQVRLIGGEIKLANPDQFPAGYAEWFATFQREFSWGADGRQSILTFETQLRALPDIVQQNLRPFCGSPIAERLPTDDDAAVLQRFIRTRQIFWEGRPVLMPLIELINHSANQSTWDIQKNFIRVGGKFSDEVLIRYSVSDPIRRFLQYGFNCKEPTAFSMNLGFKHRDRTIIVRGGINFSPLKSLKVEFENEKIYIYRPLLGSRKAVKAPKRLFQEAFSSVKDVDSDVLFDQISHMNRMQILNLLKSIDQIDQPIIPKLEQTCLDQLMSLSWAIA